LIREIRMLIPQQLPDQILFEPQLVHRSVSDHWHAHAR